MTNTTVYEYTPSWLGTSATTPSATMPASNTTVNGSVSVFDEANQTAASTNNSILSDGCDDGSDDGKINPLSGICAFGKGIFKSVVNTVTNIVTDPKKLIATVATAAVCIAFPPAGVALGVVGAATGIYKGVQSIGNAFNATTDAEAKAALQDLGGATLQTGLSIAGAKASWGAMKAMPNSAIAGVTKSSAHGVKGAFETAKSYTGAYLKDTARYAGDAFKAGRAAVTGAKAAGVTGAKTAVSTAAGKAASALKQPINTAQGAFGAVSNAAKSAGYTSARAALAAPAAAAVKSTNDADMTYETAQLGALTAHSGTQTASGTSYSFYTDFPDRDYETKAAQAAAGAREVFTV